MDRSILWKAALAQALLVTALSLILASILPHSFFEDWGWLAGPGAWLVCAALTAWVLRLQLPATMLGAALAGIPSAVAVLLGVHWLGMVIAVAAFAAWCAWRASAPERTAWT